MTYREKLQMEDWKVFRTYIMERDHYACQECGKLGYDECIIIDSICQKSSGKIIILSKPLLVPTKPTEEFLRLNVHHKCYRRGREPWEYDEKELITLCPDCHKELHELTEIPVLDEKNRIISSLSKCDRCGGFGYIPEYKHIESGICFKCWGEGVLIDKLDKIF